jgi:hypothetical protein
MNRRQVLRVLGGGAIAAAVPETDPLSRQMILSQGTFLELFDLAGFPLIGRTA